ncbi:hypothetical protein ACLOJK_029608, partial [Asimina triloba]
LQLLIKPIADSMKTAGFEIDGWEHKTVNVSALGPTEPFVERHQRITLKAWRGNIGRLRWICERGRRRRRYRASAFFFFFSSSFQLGRHGQAKSMAEWFAMYVEIHT